MRLALVLAFVLGPSLVVLAAPAPAQEAVAADAYEDARARELVRLARARRAVVDTRITAYETTAHQRISARMAVAGLEKLLFRRETAARIEWTRDTVRIEMLGAREVQPLISGAASRPPPDIAGLMPALAFDPVDSEMLLRLDSTVIRHPLGPGSEAFYRFAGGDSTAIRLPDGRTVRLLELRISARRPDRRLINGSFWLDAETHAVVRAAFRLSRGFSSAGSGVTVLKPEVSAELEHVAIDYGLWDLRWWLPRLVVARGVVSVAGVRLPLAYERSYADYVVRGDSLPSAAAQAALGSAERPCRPSAFGSVMIRIGEPTDTVKADSTWNAAWDRSVERLAAGDTTSTEGKDACDRAFLVSRADGVDLARSPFFTADVYDESEGPVSEADLETLAGLLESIPRAPWGFGSPSLQLLTPELVRFNRVEGLSLGARAVFPFGPAELAAELRAGTAGEVGARLEGSYSAPGLRTQLAGYRGLEAVGLASQPFSLASSAGALLLGRDENDYFRGTGLELLLSPPPSRPRAWDLRLFAERQEPVGARTDASLRGLFDGDFATRANLPAEPLDQAGLTLHLRAARGDDPARLRTHAELELHAETGDRSFTRPLLRLGADRRFGRRLGVGLGLAAGSGFGEVPLQRQWQIGGATSVRGHDPAALRGESLWLARGEVSWGVPGTRLSLFGDAGWAGEREELWSSTPLGGAGVGVTFLDLLRVDLARGIGGGGLRLHLRMGGAL